MADDEKDDILDDLDPTGPDSAEAPDEGAAPAETVTPEGQTTGENESGPPPDGDAAPSEPTEKDGMVPISALLDERRKRQAVEAQLKADKTQGLEIPDWAVPAKQAQPDTPATPQPQPNARKVFDSDGNLVDLDGVIREAVSPFQERLEAVSREYREEASINAAKGRHADFDAAVQGFRYEAALNPQIVNQAGLVADPGEFIYQIGQRRLSLERAMIAKPSDDRAVQPQAAGGPPQQQKEQPSVPKSLSDAAAPGGAPRTAPVPDDPFDGMNTHF